MRRLLAHHRGVALIAVLWALLFAGLILVGVQQATRIATAVGYNELASVQAHWLARAGVEHAIAELALTDPGVSSTLDYWYDDPLTFEAVELGAGEFSVIAPPSPDVPGSGVRYGLQDHAARLNVNIADAEALERLDLLDDNQIAAVLDWRDDSGQVRPGGAGQAHYERLTYPYAIRNGPLHTLKELRLIRGIDDRVYFGEGASPHAMLFPGAGAGRAPTGGGDDPRALGLARLATVYSHSPNLTSLGDTRVNLNSADAQTLQDRLNLSQQLAQAVMQAREFESIFGLLEVNASSGGGPQPGPAADAPDEDTVTEITLEWLADNFDELTLSDEEQLRGLININTAPWPVLMTLPQVTAAVADGIIAHRTSAAGPFYSVGELLDVREVDEDIFRAMAEQVAVTSDVFEITSLGVTTRGMRQQIVAVVERQGESFRILYWYQSE